MSQAENYINPFPGLRSFEEEEEHLFFGREKQIDELLSRLGKTRFLAVVGASGSGKSSLVKSGLLPSLHAGFLSSAGSGWRICTFRPGNDPIGNLAHALCSAEILGEENRKAFSPAAIEAILRRSDNGIGETIRQLDSRTGQNLLIVVDQFEELFRFSKYEKNENKDSRDSVSFINLLLAASRYTHTPVYVVFTMRSDFLGDCTEFRGLPEAINNGQYLIPRMTREERKAAITGPVAVGGAEMSQALLTRLLNDVGDNPDQLPILQHALMRTWNYWQQHSQPGTPLDLQHYEAIGTMSSALSLHAEEAYSEISDEQGREICKKLFRSLTEKRDDGRGIRRPSLLSEVCEIAGVEINEVSQVVEIFRKPGRSFLMPPPGVELEPGTVIDISHESLMRVWKRLMGWVQEEIESAELYLRLAQSAELYQLGKTGLWRDPELQMALNWAKNHKPNQSWASRYNASFDRAINFLNYSESEKNRKIKAEERRRRAAILRLRSFVVFITLALCMSVYFGFNSYESERNTKVALGRVKKEKTIADSATQAAQKQKSIADLASVKAHQAELQAKTSASLANLSEAEARKALDIARESERVAYQAEQSASDSAREARKARERAEESANLARKALSKVKQLRMLAEAKNMAAKSAALASNSDKDTISLQLAMLAYAINKKLGGPGQIKLIYDALKSQLDKYHERKFYSRRDILFEPASYDIKAVAFIGPDRFVTAGDRGVMRLWDISDSLNELRLAAVSNLYNESFTSLSLHPSGNLLLAGSAKGSLMTWSPDDPKNSLKHIYSGRSKCLSLFFLCKASNNYCFAAVFEKEVLILTMDATTKKVSGKKAITGLPDKITAASCFMKDKSTYLLVASGHEVYQVRTDAGGNFEAPVKLTVPFDEKITSLAAGGSGQVLALGGEKGGLSLYTLAAGYYDLLKQIRGHTSEVSSVCFSENDSLLVSASLDWSLRLSRVFGVTDEDLVLRDKQAWIRQAVLSPGNRHIISVGQSSLIQAWPAGQNEALVEVKKIGLYKKYLDSPLNEKRLKEELGLELFNSLMELNKDQKNLQETWKELKQLYLN